MDPDSAPPPPEGDEAPGEVHEGETGEPKEQAPTADAGGTQDPLPRPPDPNATIPLSEADVARIVEENSPSDPDDPLVGTLLRNKWRVLERIGAGSFGTVYKVKDVNGEWIEALKILSVDRLRGADAENMRKRFLREAQIMKRLGNLSPHIVGLSTYEDDIEAGLIYFLMEHVEGRVLSDVLLDEGPLSVDRTIRIGLQVCDAMIAAHESDPPVVHRDLKLENLMMTTDRDGEESVKVLDFGIAKLTEQEGDSRLTAQGTLGTPGYAAPEQLRAEEVDGRTDLFAFGVILYSLITGKNPWLGHLAYQPTNQTFELMAASDRAEVIPIDDPDGVIPQGMVDIIMKLLQREPGDRFQSARELRDALYQLGGGEISGGRLQLTRALEPMPGGAMPTQTESSGPERMLAAVWFADLVGYSTLSSQDEELALTLLDIFHKTARREVEGGGGRIVQFIGDAAFAHFQSTQRAVKTAVDFMEAFAADTKETGHTPQLRIGVHVGDVLMASDGDLFGDGVNVAARIQNEADPGQILVSQDVWRQLNQRKDFGFQSIGERSLKGIGAPVHLFAVVEAGAATTGEIVFGDPTTAGLDYPGAKKSGKGKLLAAAVVAALVLGGGAYAAMNMGAEEPDTIGAPAPGPGEDGPTSTDPGNVVDNPVDGGQDGGGDDPVVEPPPVVVDDTPDPGTVDNTPTVDPFESVYADRLAAVRATRTAARAAVHSAMQTRLDEAESLWSQAASLASAGSYQQAVSALSGAEPIYREVQRNSSDLDNVDAARNRVNALRGAAVNPELVAQAEGRMNAAETAASGGRYADAVSIFGEAEQLMRQAATPVADDPPDPPAVVFDPQAIVADVITRLRAAYEAEDVSAVLAVETNANPAGLFESFSDIRASYTATDITVITPGERLDATLEVEFTFREDPGRLGQTRIYTITRNAAGEWVIVANREAGG